jgi:formate-dependent nitrite reductase membrane component NrfD
LPILFVCSGTAAAAALLEFFSWNDQELTAIERFGMIGKIGELVAAVTLERDASRVERVGRPLKRGFSGFLWNSAKVLTVAGIVVALLPGKGRGKRIVSGVLGTAGSICTRFAIFYAGKVSARDPRATFDQQRHTPPPSVRAHLST